MASSGPNSGGTFADDATVGTQAWANPDNAASTDNSYAVASRVLSAGISHYLKATNFGFSIPAGATIDGIYVEAEIKSSTTGSCDYNIKIVKGGTISGDDLKRAASTYWPTSDTYVSWGGATALWGLTWSAGDINNSGFGVAIAAQIGAIYQTCSIDHIRITVYYTAATVLTIQSATHSHSVDALVLTQVHNLTIAETAHGHAADGLVLTQLHNLAVAGSDHALSSESPALTQVHNLTIASSDHTLISESPVLTQLHNLDIAETSHALTSEVPVLIEHKTLAIASAGHALLSEEPVLIQLHNLVVASADHALTSESPTLTQLHNL